MITNKTKHQKKERSKKIDLIRKLASQGKGLAEISKELDSHIQTVSKWSKQYGIHIQTSFMDGKNKEKIAIKVWNETKSFEEVAKAINVSFKHAKVKIRDYIKNGKCEDVKEARSKADNQGEVTIFEMEKKRLSKMPNWIAEHIKSQRATHGVTFDNNTSHE